MIRRMFPLPPLVEKTERDMVRGISVTIGIGLGCSLFVVIMSIFFSGLFTAWENKTLDYRFRLRGDIPVHPDIALIDIDDVSMKAIGRWPWNRTYHGRMIDILGRSGAAAVGYDVLFDQPSGDEEDKALQDITRNAKNLYYPVGFSLKDAPVDLVPPIKDAKSSPELLKQFAIPQQINKPGKILNVDRAVIPFEGLFSVSWGAGHISSNRDPDGTIRRVPLVVNSHGSLFPAFGLIVSAAYLRVPPENILVQPGSYLLFKGARKSEEDSRRDLYIPLDNKGMMLINYAGSWEKTFTHYSFIDVLKAAGDEKGIRDLREALEGKIVIVSNTATGYDLKPTPVEVNFPGGGIHANIINTILSENFLREISPAGKILMLIILSIGSAWLTTAGIAGRDWKVGLFSFLLLLAGYWVVSYTVFSRLGMIIEVVSPSLVMVFSYLTGALYGRSLEQRRSVRISGEMEHLGRSLKTMSRELSEKEGELLNLREELSKRMSTFNTMASRDDESIQKIAFLEGRVEDVLKEKDLLLESKQQLEMKLARILSKPLHSEYPLEGEWEGLQKECARYGIITRNKKVLKIFEQIKKAAQTKNPVLILGESGTGKELFARAIHGLSPRSERHLMIVDTPAMSDTLFESDLFGHVKGAFTGAINDRKGYFEMAQGGTLFLDEIGDLSARIQAGLLGVLQRYEIKRVGSSSPVKIDVRVIAATNRNLSEDIVRGVFREDLYYRLNVLSVELPPLRERIEDIEPLVHYFLRKYCAENGIADSAIKGLTSDALGLLKAHPWKGNVRELENVIARAVTMATGKWITEADIGLLPKGPSSFIPSSIPSPLAGEGQGGGDFEDAGDAAFLSLLEKNEFSIEKTARILGESRGTVAHRFKGICFEHLAACNGDTDRASFKLFGKLSGKLTGGKPESLRKVKQRMEEYYKNLLDVTLQYENAEEAITECRRRFKNLKGRYFIAVETLIKNRFEKNRQV